MQLTRDSTLVAPTGAMPRTADAGTLAWYDRMAETYSEIVSRDAPDDDLKAFIRLLDPGAGPILDWGCGPGNTAAMLASLGFEGHATDASQKMAELAAGLGIRVRVEPFENLSSTPRYQGIWSNFGLSHICIEHVPPLLSLAANALLPGGILHLGMTTWREGFEDGDRSGRDCFWLIFTQLHPDTLRRLLTSVGLEVLSLRETSFEMMLSGGKTGCALVLARKTATP